MNAVHFSAVHYCVVHWCRREQCWSKSHTCWKWQRFCICHIVFYHFFFSSGELQTDSKTSSDNIWSHINQNARHNVRLTSDRCAQNMKDLVHNYAILGHTLSVYHISVPPKSILNCYNLSLGFPYLYPTRFQSKYDGNSKGAFVFMVRRCCPVVCALSTSR